MRRWIESTSGYSELKDIENILNDENLVRQAQQGDREAFGCLVERHFGLVFTVALARLGDREAAEDLSQEVFLRLFLGIRTLRDRQRFPNWAARVTRNLATDWVRRQQTRSRLVTMVGESENQCSPGDNARERIAEAERDEALARALKGLDSDHREAVLLHYVNGLTKREIADRLGLHGSTVGRRIDTALGQLRGALAELPSRPPAPVQWTEQAVVRSVALVAATASLSTAAQAKLVGSTAMAEGSKAVVLASQSLSSGGLRIIATKVAGGLLMGKAAACAVGVVVISLGAAGLYSHKNARHEQSAVVASNVAMDWLPPLPAAYKLQVKPASGQGSRTVTGSGSFKSTRLDLQSAIMNAWNVGAGRIASVPAGQSQLDFALTAPKGTSEGEFGKVLQNELQRAYGVRVSTERRAMPCLILKKTGEDIPPGFTPRPGVRQGGTQSSTRSTVVTAQPLTVLCRSIEAETRKPVIDETGLDRLGTNYDYRWIGSPRKAAVEQLGLQISEETREIDMLTAKKADGK